MNIKLTKLHENQLKIKYNLKRFNVIACGRRFGKNILLADIAIKRLLTSKSYVGWMEPQYKTLDEIYRTIVDKLKPVTKNYNNSLKRLELYNGSVIEFWSLSNPDSIRGRRYHLAIINEAAMYKNLENVWNEIIRSTLIDFQGQAIFSSTPKGKNFFYKLFKKSQNDRKWKSFRFTTYDNPKISRESIEIEKDNLDSITFQQEIEAKFVSHDGNFVKSNMIKYFDINNYDISNLEIVMGVDLAISESTTADYTVCAVMGRDKTSGKIYILDIVRFKAKFSEIIDTIQNVAIKWNVSKIGIEVVQAQAWAFQEAVRTTNLNIVKVKADKGKKQRFLPLLARFEQKLVFISNKIGKECVDEIENFPLDKHDDIPDSLAYGFRLFDMKRKAYFSL